MNVIAPQRRGKAERGPIEVARGWLDEYGQAALATVVSTWGSAPVPVGGQLVVAPGDRFEGSVSGGCVEADVIAEAADVMATGRPQLLEFGVQEETAWRAGLPCGGTITVLLEPLERSRDRDYLDAVITARRERKALVVVTELSTGIRHVFAAGVSMPPDIAARMAEGVSCLIERAEGQAFIQALVPPVRIVIIGATHVGQVLTDLAKRIGYDVVVVDPRSTFAAAERFASAVVLTEWPENSLNSLGLDAHTAVVALAHAAHLDDEALSAALRSDCRYVGALGSRTTHAKRLERLRAAGVSENELGRIHAPIGLSIGAKGPAEIAVSILAEIVKVTRAAA
jgi:xanthine dehydrogenase accessory factor